MEGVYGGQLLYLAENIKNCHRKMINEQVAKVRNYNLALSEDH